MVASLVEGSTSLSVGRDLLDEVGNLDRGRGAGLVEDCDDVERSVLFGGKSSQSASNTVPDITHHSDELPSSIALTKRNMVMNWALQSGLCFLKMVND